MYQKGKREYEILRKSKVFARKQIASEKLLYSEKRGRIYAS